MNFEKSCDIIRQLYIYFAFEAMRTRRYKMTAGNERRKKILDRLSSSSEPINATDLGKMLSVTRQIIVGDIALLRASGVRIRALHRGYVLDKDANSGVRRSLMVKHTKEQTRDEFYAIVDNGAVVLDVSIEHPVYGCISAELNIASRYEADLFIEKTSDDSILHLSSLTDGYHIHTVLAKDEATLDRVTDALKNLGILVDNT